MSLHKLYEQMESEGFSAYINAASGLSVVLLEFEQNATMNELRRQLEQMPGGQQQLIERIQSLLDKAAHDEEFALLHDAALAAYLYTLHLIAPQSISRILDPILQTPKLFWTKRLAQHLQTLQPNLSAK